MAQDSISATNSVQACENIIDPEPFRERGLFVSSRIGKTGFNCVYVCKIGLHVNKAKGEGESRTVGRSRRSALLLVETAELISR